MFVNVSPAAYNVGETLCSLNFAARCRAVELGYVYTISLLNSNTAITNAASNATFSLSSSISIAVRSVCIYGVTYSAVAV
jgi:hypothetical protein